MKQEKTKELIYPTIISAEGEPMVMEVCWSAAGYYLGYMSIYHGPYSRESAYFKTYEEAADTLISWAWALTDQLEEVNRD